MVEADGTSGILASIPPTTESGQAILNSSTQSHHEGCHSEAETKSAGRFAHHRHFNSVLVCRPAASARPGIQAGARTRSRSAAGSAHCSQVLGTPPMLVGPPMEMVTAQGPTGSRSAPRVSCAGSSFGLDGFEGHLASTISAHSLSAPFVVSGWRPRIRREARLRRPKLPSCSQQSIAFPSRSF